MGNPVPDPAPQQNVIHGHHLFLILLLLLHGYYNFVRTEEWLNGALGLVKEAVTITVVVQFCFGNYHASRDSRRHAAERNVRRAAHAANVTGTVFIAVGLIWGCYVLTTHEDDVNDNENAFNLMNNRLYLVALMTMAFFIRLCLSKPGVDELEFFKYVLRYPWRFIWPARRSEMFRGGQDGRW
ncbi:hypothetical protein J3459_015888 [Metarhizium acridum]|uniref:Uncharacterized protein n=1 Tax=Metarhizium acridum (strain CQMa 102) TaxID=655827 RepID=E9EG42_METAQ|nr:uncharacterized protein MAC_08840 [Metarhizium acridum CQMa 102]EFY85125.1 hypothetical protein MAC_08840 [Metarhizium acridum CQMa 102]KAG8411220.1 hypothetical protein J3459_016507 [Metarhizium acridum]KAG8412512.1 hypothetical protein J3459_015888 [Metarhizium acridum]